MDRDTSAIKAVSAPPQNAPRFESSWEKNEFYRDGFRNMMWAINIQMALIVLLTAFFAVYVKTYKGQDHFFAATAEGKKMPLLGLSQPNMGRIPLMNWVAQAATQIMTFGFSDIDQRFTMSRIHFTQQGWDSFHSAMIASGLVVNVIKLQQIITSVPKEPPVLLQEGVFSGKYEWVFEMPLLITFRAGSLHQAEVKMVHIVLEQVPTSDNPSGVGIAEWYIY